MKDYADHIYQKFTQSIAGWEASLRSDIYALNFFIGSGMSGSDAAGETIHYDGIVGLCYSTVTGLKSYQTTMSESPVGKWFGCHGMTQAPAEVPQVTWQEDPDAEEWALRDAWFASFGIVPEERDSAGRTVYDYGKDEERAIVLACQRVIWRMHHGGFLQQSFGRPLPILISHGEGIIKFQETVRANPRESVGELIEFVENLPIKYCWLIGIKFHVPWDDVHSETDLH